jgi:hypothetical protein
MDLRNTVTNAKDVVITTVKVVDSTAEKKVYDLVSFFSQLFNGTEKLNELKSKLTYNIDDKVVVLIKLLVENSPDSIKAISLLFEEISADGKLDLNDVPKIVLVITQLYKTNLKELFGKNALKVENLLELIKFIVHSVIELDLVKVDDKQKIFQILDVSLLLLDTTLELPIPSVTEVKTFCWSFCNKKKL